MNSLLRKQSGGIGLRITLAVVTLILLVGGVIWVVRTFQETQQTHLRRATQISEDGLLQALQNLQESPSWRGPIGRTECEDGWYQVTVSRDDSAGRERLLLTSDGHSGSIVRRQICVLLLSINGSDSVWIQQSMKQE